MKLEGVLVGGHRVASGPNQDPRFPGGTLAMQLPHFLRHGVDLGAFRHEGRATARQALEIKGPVVLMVGKFQKIDETIDNSERVKFCANTLTLV